MWLINKHNSELHAMDELEIYQSEEGSLELSVTIDSETVWLSQYQMQTLFGRERSVITKHTNNVLKTVN